MKQFFLSLLDYNHHYNQKLADVFVEHAGKASPKSVQLFNHILNAHHIWNSRIEQRVSEFGVWDLHNAELLKNIDELNLYRSVEILNTHATDEIITYTNTKGETFSNTVNDILYHVLNHSTYHRGQIAMALKECGIEPLITDFIFYKRRALQ